MPDGSLPGSSNLSLFTNRRMPNGTYGGVRGRRPHWGRPLLDSVTLSGASIASVVEVQRGWRGAGCFPRFYTREDSSSDGCGYGDIAQYSNE